MQILCFDIKKIFLTYFYHIDEYVDGGVDGEHQVIALRENLGPGWPKEELAIGYNLVCLIRIGNQLSNSINQSMENLSKLFICLLLVLTLCWD